jgi:serine/threonine-protein kinase
MLAETGQAMLTDFGIALALDDVALTRTGHTIGTAAYMAPEQADSSRMVDGRADLYSLGIVLYQMVTGQAPFQGTIPQVLHAQLYSAPPPPTKKAQISPALEAIILRALEKEPNERYQTGAALAQALATVGDTTSIHPTAVAVPASKAPSRWLKGAMALGLLLLIAWAAAAGWQWVSPQISTPPTQSLTTEGQRSEQALIAAATPVTATEIVPTPTPVAVVPATVLPSATPTPLPTATPQPTSTELPIPTQSPTLLPPTAPTLSPTPTPCPQPVAVEFLPLLADGLNAQQLGCPKSSERIIATAWQPFERGEMLWRSDANLIYILLADNTWRSIGDTWRDGDLDFDPAIVPPDGRLQPVRGFGKVWREQQGIQETLGWAAAEELGGDGNIQEFSAGIMWHIPALERFFILFNDGTYALNSQ